MGDTVIYKLFPSGSLPPQTLGWLVDSMVRETVGTWGHDLFWILQFK